MDRGNFGDRCCSSVCLGGQKQVALCEWIEKGSHSSTEARGAPECCRKWRGALRWGCAVLRVCSSRLAGLYLLLFALSQAHWIAAAKYSFALASGIEICAEMFDLCNDCRVFLKVWLSEKMWSPGLHWAWSSDDVSGLHLSSGIACMFICMFPK